MRPSIEGMPELGWVLMSQAQGKGYATEGLRAAQAWGDAHFGLLRTVCIIHRDNLASLRVAEKLSYKTILRASTDVEPDAMLVRAARGAEIGGTSLIT